MTRGVRSRIVELGALGAVSAAGAPTLPLEVALETRTSAPSGRPPLLATLIATALGAGFIPIAPGTWGTAVAIPLAWALGQAGWLAYALVTLAVIVAGSVAADTYCRATGLHDNQRIVIDEVAGYLITLAFVSRTLPNLLAGFLLFRLFDIWKPPPVRWVDRHVEGGLGVVLDDVAAGVYGALALWLIDHFHLLARLGLR